MVCPKQHSTTGKEKGGEPAPPLLPARQLRECRTLTLMLALNHVRGDVCQRAIILALQAGHEAGRLGGHDPGDLPPGGQVSGEALQ
jgi:hypothetical protein